MSTISVKTHFAAGHRILGLTGAGEKCRNLHGHTFWVTWVFKQDASDMAIEFGELKHHLKSMISTRFDHAFILDASDDLVHYLNANMLKKWTLDGPPTTEAIVAEIAKLTIDKLTRVPAPGITSISPPPKALWPNAKLVSVHLEEGPENSATWTPGVITEIADWGGNIVLESEVSK